MLIARFKIEFGGPIDCISSQKSQQSVGQQNQFANSYNTFQLQLVMKSKSMKKQCSQHTREPEKKRETVELSSVVIFKFPGQ